MVGGYLSQMQSETTERREGNGRRPGILLIRSYCAILGCRRAGLVVHRLEDKVGNDGGYKLSDPIIFIQAVEISPRRQTQSTV